MSVCSRPTRICARLPPTEIPERGFVKEPEPQGMRMLGWPMLGRPAVVDQISSGSRFPPDVLSALCS